jgi:tRNA dimethylallyltransferase
MPSIAPLAIIGPTASGKSAVALELARQLGPRAEILSVDSMQVYRGMDIGTAKPTPAERAEIRHHLIDLVEPSEDYTVAAFARDAGAVMDRSAADVRLILAGGTGLYLRAALGDLDVPGQFPAVRRKLEADPDTLGLHRRLARLDPVAAGRMEPNNRRRVIRALEVTIGGGRPFSSFGPGLTAYPPSPVRLFGLRMTRVQLDERIERRYEAQLARGFLDEVRALDVRPEGWSRTASQALGYRELLDHLAWRCSLEEAVARAVIRTRQFARRQERWFRRDPRITWIDLPGTPPEPLAAVPLIVDALRQAETIRADDDPPATLGGHVGGERRST